MGTPAHAAGPRGLLPHRLFRAGGESYLYAAESGGLFRLDGEARAAWSALSRPGARPASPELLPDLVRAGLIRSGKAGGECARAPIPPLRLRTLVLMLTDACNLACRYCYEGEREECARPPGAGEAGREMSAGTFRRSVSFLLDRSGEARRVSVVLFGGEPLLRYPLLRRAVPEAREMARKRGKEISFSLTTNGTLLTPEIAAFLRENRVSVCVSIDGPSPVHDRNRPYPSGRGSYDDVARGVSLLAEAGYPVAARVTLGRGAGDVQGIFEHLRALGFSEIGFAPVSGSEGSSSLPAGWELDRAMRGFRRLAEGYVEEVRERRMPAFSNLTQILSLIHRGDPMPYPCGAGIGMLAADPSGVLHPCHRLRGVGSPLGDPVRGVSGPERSRFLASARRGRTGACGSCWAKNLCAGGCYHDAWLRQGDPFAPSVHYCRWIRRLFLLGLATYVRIECETPTFLEAMFGERGNA